jgi:hypothetical protein
MVRRLLVSRISAPQMHFFLQKMLITATTAVSLLFFYVSIAISSALMLFLGAVLMISIGKVSVDN